MRVVLLSSVSLKYFIFKNYIWGILGKFLNWTYHWTDHAIVFKIVAQCSKEAESPAAIVSWPFPLEALFLLILKSLMQMRTFPISKQVHVDERKAGDRGVCILYWNAYVDFQMHKA